MLTGLELGLFIAQNGWRVFPASSYNKKPLIKGWVTKATTDAEQIKAWAEQFKACNWAIATGKASGIFIIDLDPRNGSDQTVKNLEADGKVFPSTYSVSTPSGGQHLYFKYPEYMQVKSSGELFKTYGDGIDCQADKRAAMAPFSKIKGKVYAVKPCKVAEPPVWLLEIVERKPEPEVLHFVKHIQPGDAMQKYVNKAFEGELNELSMASEGDRNNTLCKISFKIGTLVGGGYIPLDVAERALMDISVNRLGLSNHEAKPTIQSGLSGGMKHPRNLSSVKQAMPYGHKISGVL